MAKTLNARIITKHDKEENWRKATSFIPKLGEIVVYEADNLARDSVVPRIKVGDGLRTISDLAFITDPYVLKETGKGLSANDFTNIHKQKVDAIPDDPQYSDTTYTAGPGIGLDGTSFYNKGVVAIEALNDGVSFNVVTRTKFDEVSTDLVTISNLVNNATKNEIVQLAMQELPNYILTSPNPGEILVSGQSVKIGGWNTLGELAFKNWLDIESQLDVAALPEILITENTENVEVTSNIKLWIREQTLELYYRDSGGSYRNLLPNETVTGMNTSEQKGYITITDTQGNYELKVNSDITFSSGSTNGAFNVVVDGTSQIVSIYGLGSNAFNSTAYLPLAGGTVTGVATFSNTTASTSTTTGAVTISGGLGVAGSIYGNKVHGAVYNDYAEYRQSAEPIEPGYIVYSGDNGVLHKTVARMQFFEGVVSDTFGFSIGQTEKAQTPLAVAGRVLVYTDEELHAGNVVCAGPGGKASKMTKQEIKEYPDRIVGVVSEVPTYETWGEANVPVNDRVWIRV